MPSSTRSAISVGTRAAPRTRGRVPDVEVRLVHDDDLVNPASPPGPSRPIPRQTRSGTVEFPL